MVLAFHLLLYLHQPQVRRDKNWCTNVMRNWHEYGYWQMGGQLVANPGGLAAGEKPSVYPRHRPTFLIIPYLLKELPGQAVGDGSLYDTAILALLFTGALVLMGVNTRGLVTASALCLAPGVLNNVTNIDTISTPALVGIGVMCIACGIFSRGTTDRLRQSLAVVVMLVYMTLNWSTLFSLGVAAVYILCRVEQWKKVAVWFVAAGIAGLGVLAISLISLHQNNASPDGTGTLWNSYLWGPLGYDGTGMNFGKAFVRITAVNVIAWLSLVLAALALLSVYGRGKYWTRAAWPALAGIAAVFAMRNYNAHHPWGAVCIVGLGLVLSLDLLTAPETVPAMAKRPLVFGGLVAALAIYLVAWLAADEFNSRSEVPVHQLVAAHTGRHSLLVISGELLPETPLPANLGPYQEEFDRKVQSFDQWQSSSTNVPAGREVFFLAHEPFNFPGAKLVASSEIASDWTDKILGPLLDFYRKDISRRAPGNRKTYYEQYQLYQCVPAVP